MKIRNLLLAVTLGLSFAGVANAQVIGYSPRSGDIWVDTQLGYMNDYGRDNRDYFVNDVVTTYGAPRYLVNDLLNTRHWAPGDVYYACAMAYQMRRPCGDVAKMYEQDRGQGWGVVAQRMGIKPGSAQFHALKGDIGKSNGKYKSHPGKGNSPGNSGNKAKGGYDDSPGNSGNPGKGNSGKGNSGKGNENAGDNGKDKGNSGKGKPNGGAH